jgi:O-acetyl-ADP-ribose deacetylase (regulator of RNase III)
MKILQCHTKGDKRFSPFCCYLSAFNLTKSIEDHYQSAKRFEGKPAPKNWREAKAMQKAGIKRIGFELPNGIWLPPDTNNTTDLAVQYYIALWYKYLKLNPHLIEYASQFEQFEDIFKGKFPFCQADIIRQSVQHGIESLKPMCEKFMTLCRQIINRDILTIDKGIIGHNVNCQGISAEGLAMQIRHFFPEAGKAYHEKWCEYYNLFSRSQLLGKCLTVKINEQLYVAHLFGQYWIGPKTKDNLEYPALEKALTKLERFGNELNLPIYLPYKLGCGLAGGDWSTVCDLILTYCPSATICKLQT